MHDNLVRGHPPKLLQPGVREKILSALSKGASYRIACGYAGVAYQTFRNWMKIAEDMMDLHEEQIDAHIHKYVYDFYWEVKRIESYAACKWLEKIDAASDFHWQAAAWKLERRFPDDFGRFEREEKSEEDSSLDKARSEVSKLKDDDHGRSTSTES